MNRTAKKKNVTADLGSERVLGLFVSKWSIKVMHALARGEKRHGELRRELQPVSQKVLTRTLRDLEGAGLIERRTVSLKPLAVEYRLSKLGNSFIAPLNALCRWAHAHRKQLNQIYARSASPKTMR